MSQQMTARRTDLSDLPNWPRLLSRAQAAAYVGLSEPAFGDRVGKVWPEAVSLGKRKLWDRRELDEAVDRLNRANALSAHDMFREALKSETTSETRQ